MSNIKNHTLALVRWMDACDNIEQLQFCNQVLLLFLLKTGRNTRLPPVAWNNISSYLHLCMQNKRQALQQAAVASRRNLLESFNAY